MLIKLSVTTRENTELTIWWSISRTPYPWEIKHKARMLCKPTNKTYRSHTATVVSK